MYRYRVRAVLAVVDGDTVDLRIDLGFGIHASLRVRLVSVDTPELRGANAEPEAAAAARDFTAAWLADRADRLILESYKGSQAAVGIGDGAFGRWLGLIVDADTGETLTDALHDAGHHRP